MTEKQEAQRRHAMEARLREGRFLDTSRKPATYCKDYRLGYWVVWNGMMRFCSFMDEPNIPVRNLPFKEAWSQLLAFEEALDWPEECKTCQAAKVCQRCAASVAAEQGKGRPSPRCKQIQQLYLEWKGD